MFLRNYNKFNEILSIYEKKIFIDNIGTSTCGFFIKSENDVLGIYVKNSIITIRYNDKDIYFNDILSFEYESNIFRIIEKNNKVLQYKNLDLQSGNDLFFNEEEEDQDLCLLIIKIFQNRDRQKIFIDNNSC